MARSITPSGGPGVGCSTRWLPGSVAFVCGIWNLYLVTQGLRVGCRLFFFVSSVGSEYWFQCGGQQCADDARTAANLQPQRRPERDHQDRRLRRCVDLFGIDTSFSLLSLHNLVERASSIHVQ